jgi:hypothetical protein
LRRKNKTLFIKEAPMNSIADGSVIIQTSSQSMLSTPSWFGEATLIVEYLRKQGVLSAINERVRGCRGGASGAMRSSTFLPSSQGYAISGERTLEAFYEELQPFAPTFMALFDRDQLPARSTLSRFLTALTQEPVEALRALFLDDLESRPLLKERQTGGLKDRGGGAWVVFDIDGTREAARVSRLAPDRRAASCLSPIGYSLCCWLHWAQARGNRPDPHCYQSGTQLPVAGLDGRAARNGLYRKELRQALAAIGRYLAAHQLPPERALLRLDGQYGTGAVLADLAGFSFVMRGKDYAVLDHPLVQARLHLPPDQLQHRTAKPAGAQPL